MKRNLLKLYARVPRWIEHLGGHPDNWRLTIVDEQPPLQQLFGEMEEEGMPWPTEIVFRHRNSAKLSENWRRENQEFVNNMARADKLMFHLDEYSSGNDDESPGAYALHDQVMQTIDVPDDYLRETAAGNTKGWQISDPFRGDHVVDAWYLAMWSILSQQLVVSALVAAVDSSDPWASQKAQFAKSLKDDEDRELRPFKRQEKEPTSGLDAFQKLIQPHARGWGAGNYEDES
jgi:hypothetical protein